jgi:hypothetical protein
MTPIILFSEMLKFSNIYIYIYIIFNFFPEFFFPEGKERILMEYLRIYDFVEMKYILKMK